MNFNPLARRSLHVLSASLVAVCLAMAGAAGAQTPAANSRAAAARALDRGNYAEVHRLLAGLADDTRPRCCAPAPTWRSGSTREAEKVLQPAVFENPIGDAAVELGILQRHARQARRPPHPLPDPLARPRWRPRRPTTCGPAAPPGPCAASRTPTASSARPTPRRPPMSPSTWPGASCSSRRTNAAKRRDPSRRRCGPMPNIPRRSSGWRAPSRKTIRRWRASWRRRCCRSIRSTPVRVCWWPSSPSTTPSGPRRPPRSRQALAVNPNHFEALSLKAAIAWLEKRTDDYAATTDALLKLNPAYGEVYRVVGAVAARQYRFEDAAELARRALTVDRENVRAYADLGAHLMRTGDERGARRALETAFRADPFDRVTYNLLALLDTLDGFETIRDGDLVIRLHPDEAAVMREYVPALAREALAALSKRWNFTPEGPILIEMFPRHDDFAVRTLGLPGHDRRARRLLRQGRHARLAEGAAARATSTGARRCGTRSRTSSRCSCRTSACRGGSPRASRSGRRRGRGAAWGREMEVTFAGALNRGQVMKLRDLNSGFSNPELISLAYYEASLLVEHIVARFGEAVAARAGARVLRGSRHRGRRHARARGRPRRPADDLRSLPRRAVRPRCAAPWRRPRASTPDAPLERLRARWPKRNPGSFPVQLALGARARGAGSRRRARGLPPGGRARADRDRRRAARRRASPRCSRPQGDKSRGRGSRSRRSRPPITRPWPRRARWSGCSMPAPRGPRRQAALARVVAIDPFDAAAHSELGRFALDGRPPARGPAGVPRRRRRRHAGSRRRPRRSRRGAREVRREGRRQAPGPAGARGRAELRAGAGTAAAAGGAAAVNAGAAGPAAGVAPRTASGAARGRGRRPARLRRAGAVDARRRCRRAVGGLQGGALRRPAVDVRPRRSTRPRRATWRCARASASGTIRGPSTRRRPSRTCRAGCRR